MGSSLCKFKSIVVNFEIKSAYCGGNIIITDEHPAKVYILRSRKSSSVHNKQAQCIQSSQNENPIHS